MIDMNGVAWTTVAISAVPAVAALTGVVVKGRLDEASESRRARVAAYQRLSAATERLALRAVTARGDRTGLATLAQTIKSLEPFLTASMVLALARAPKKKPIDANDLGMLISRLPPGVDPGPSVSDTEVLLAYEEVQQAAAHVEIVGSAAVKKVATDLYDSATSFLRLAVRPALRERRRQIELREARDAMQAARRDFAEQARRDTDGGWSLFRRRKGDAAADVQ